MRIGPHTAQFIRYTVASSSTFALDLLLLWLLTDVFGVQYLISAAIAFTIAIQVNYLFSRNWAFRGTSRTFARGYVYFFAIALAGLAMVVGLMALLVEIFGLPYLPARVVVASFVGMWNFLMNKYVNLKPLRPTLSP